MASRFTLFALGATLTLAGPLLAGDVKTARVPGGGIQPQAVTDAQGTVHLLYFTGEAKGGDLHYVQSKDGGETWSAAIQVNSDRQSAVAMGTVRGAHLALGKNGRAHVAWMGAMRMGRGGGKKHQESQTPMNYARLAEDGKSFEAQRNLIQAAYGLDGGGTLAADEKGNVWVAWHAGAAAEGEIGRRVWIARSTDDGKTFAREAAASGPTGCCACCGMRSFADRKGNLYILYRAALDRSTRDMYLLVSKDQGKQYRSAMLQPWKVGTCPMSSAAFGHSAKGGALAAWETRGQVYFSAVDPATGRVSPPAAAPGQGSGRKHPVVATNGKGETLFAWTEGTGWQKGGSAHWQLYDASGKPLGAPGSADGVPAWSFAAAIPRPDGGWTLLY